MIASDGWLVPGETPRLAHWDTAVRAVHRLSLFLFPSLDQLPAAAKTLITDGFAVTIFTWSNSSPGHRLLLPIPKPEKDDDCFLYNDAALPSQCYSLQSGTHNASSSSVHTLITPFASRSPRAIVYLYSANSFSLSLRRCADIEHSTRQCI